MKPKEVRSGSLAAAPPERQLSPSQLQLTSCGSSLSLQSPWADRNVGAITMVSPSAPAMNAAPVAVRK